MTHDNNGSKLSDDDRAALAALTGLEHLGPKRLAWVLGLGRPAAALEALRGGVLPPGRAPVGVKPELVERWRSDLRAADPAAVLLRHAEAGVAILAPGDPQWPLGNDPEPPQMLYVRGDTTLLAQLAHSPVVAIVGTRRCSSIGRRVATELGHDLATAGVTVVSGLALGIDGAAHKGVLRTPDGARPIGVVATGLNLPYPASHTDLWHDVAHRGALLSEWPLGTPAARWRFPARNRIIAGLADAVIVVESHARGGALLTVDEAAARSVDVLAVPGSVLSRSCEGTNQLLMDGCAPVRFASDVLDHLGISVLPPPVASRTEKPQRQRRRESSTNRQLDLPLPARGEDRMTPSKPAAVVPVSAAERISGGPLADSILDELTAGSSTIDHLIVATQASLPDVLEMVQYLELDGLVLVDGAVVALVDAA